MRAAEVQNGPSIDQGNFLGRLQNRLPVFGVSWAAAGAGASMLPTSETIGSRDQ